MKDFKAIIEKAVEGGYDGGLIFDDNSQEYYVSDGDEGYVQPNTNDIIFSHKFAKAYWGEKAGYRYSTWAVKDGGNYIGNQMAWQYHLQQLVLSEDREKYLRGFL